MRPKGRHTGQIEGYNLVYQNLVAKSAAKCRYIKNCWFESRSPPLKSEILLNFLKVISYGPCWVFMVI